MTSKVRCTNCKGYVDRDDCFWQAPNRITRLCTERCFSEWKDRKKPSPRQVRERRTQKAAKRTSTSVPVTVRLEIRDRDNHRCRWCRRPGQQVHHIHYRSEGGADEPSNLILLCTECHARAHSSKAAYKPLLLACLWLHYVEGDSLSIPEVAEHLERLGLLSDLQQERLAG